LDQPREGEVFKEEKVIISGQTKKGTSVSINDKLIEVDKDGKFEYQIKLFPGENTIIITAINRHNKQKTITRKIKLVDNDS